MSNRNFVLPLATATLVAAQSQLRQTTEICHMAYAMADNNLEFAIVGDIAELASHNTLMDDPNYQMYVYLDRHDSDEYASGQGPESLAEIIAQKDGSWGYPLRDEFGNYVKDHQGNYLYMEGDYYGEKYSGVRYYGKDQNGNLQPMKELGEKNSDDPKNLEDFLQWALPQCKTNQQDGTDLKVVLTLSSHGGGFAGFGSDDSAINPNTGFGGRRLNSPRQLMMSNEDVKGAIQSALNQNRWISKLDLFGFDACLMMSYAAAYEFHDIAHYYIASEATEPGHGWAYNEIVWNGDYDIKMYAKSIITSFARSKHGWDDHQGPKTLALIDNTKFMSFADKFGELADTMRRAISTNPRDPADFSDNRLLEAIMLARRQTLQFASANDAAEYDPYCHAEQCKSAADIGSFLYQLRKSCGSGSLGDLIKDTELAYEHMIEYFESGSTTSGRSSGMAVFYPTRRSVTSENSAWRDWYFPASYQNSADTDRWDAFLNALYDHQGAQPSGNYVSVCDATSIINHGGSVAPSTTINTPAPVPVVTPTVTAAPGQQPAGWYPAVHQPQSNGFFAPVINWWYGFWY